ncbi:MAG: hypothetical protein GY855_13825 [candidate division Zixibacteria bacterium]|nr:hypothetical protein [candidate division Zixibacteria bacterium]
MMCKIVFAIFLCLFFIAESSGYDDRLDFGAVSSSLGGADIAVPSGSSSLLLNSGFLKYHHKFYVNFHFSNPFGIPGLNSQSATFRYSSIKFLAGVEYSNFGKKDLYAENNYRIAFGYSLPQDLYIGALLDYLSIDIGDEIRYAGSSSIGFSGGFYNGIIGAAGSVSGLSINSRNMNDSDLNPLYLIGISYGFSKMTTMYSSFGYRNSVEWLSIGQKFIINEILTINAGLKSNPVTPSFGFVIYKKYVGLCYSYKYHSILGDSHQAAIVFRIHNRK